MKHRMKQGVSRLCGALLLAFATSGASAAVIVSTGNNPQQGASGVTFGTGCATGVSAPGSVVYGCLAADPATQITFTADESVGIGAGGTVDATDASGYQRLRIAVAAGTFTSLVLNIDSIVNGRVTFYDGTTTSTAFSIDRNGSNYFTITGGPFNFIEVSATADAIESIKNVRIAGASGATAQSQSLVVQSIPEPGSLALAALTILALTIIARRRG